MFGLLGVLNACCALPNIEDQSSTPTDSSALHIVASLSMMMEDTTTEQLLANCNDLENGKLESSIKNVEGVTLEFWHGVRRCFLIFSSCNMLYLF